MAPTPLQYGLGFAFAALSGVGIALQSGINASLGAHTGQAFAGVISFVTGLVSCLIFFAVDVSFLGAPLPTLEAMRGAPAWAWLGGPLGALFVVTLIIFAPRLGAGNILAVFVTCQVASAVLLDLLGAVGYTRRTFSWQRWLGVALLGAGVALVTLFPGEPVAKGPAGPEGGAPGRPPVGRALTHLFLRPQPRLPQQGEVGFGPLRPGQAEGGGV